MSNVSVIIFSFSCSIQPRGGETVAISLRHSQKEIFSACSQLVATKRTPSSVYKASSHEPDFTLLAPKLAYWEAYLKLTRFTRGTGQLNGK